MAEPGAYSWNPFALERAHWLRGFRQTRGRRVGLARGVPSQPGGSLQLALQAGGCTGWVDKGPVHPTTLGGGSRPESPGCPSIPLPQSWRLCSTQDKNWGPRRCLGGWARLHSVKISFDSLLPVSGCGEGSKSPRPRLCPGNGRSRGVSIPSLSISLAPTASSFPTSRP